METKSKKCYVKESELPLYCPTSPMKLWSTHPRVFLDIQARGEVLCPYCGTQFILESQGVIPAFAGMTSAKQNRKL